MPVVCRARAHEADRSAHVKEGVGYCHIRHTVERTGPDVLPDRGPGRRNGAGQDVGTDAAVLVRAAPSLFPCLMLLLPSITMSSRRPVPGHRAGQDRG